MGSAGGAVRELGTVLFVDIVESTRQVASVGDERWAAVLDAFERATGAEVTQRGGHLVKTTGDGVLALLPSPTAAVECATALHGLARPLEISLRAGIHTGEIQRRPNDVAGLAVHVASRLMDLAAPGTTFVSDAVCMLATGSTCTFEPRGEHQAKGVPGRLAVHEVVPSDRDAPPVPTEQAARAGRGADDPSASVVASLLAEGQIERAAELASEIADASLVADAIFDIEGRAEFLGVDLTFVRLIEDVLDRLPSEDHGRRARLASKLAYELRGDQSTLARRRELLDVAVTEADRAGDPSAVIAATMDRVDALWEPAGTAERLAATERVIALAREHRDIEHELRARPARVRSLVELGRVDDAELELATYARLVASEGRADLDAFVEAAYAFLAATRGRLDDAVRHGEAAYEAAKRAGMPDAERLGMLMRGVVGFERADDELMDAAVQQLRDLARRLPGHHFEADAAAVLVALGRPREARIELARAMPALLGQPAPYRWLHAACQAAEAAAAVSTEDTCRQLYEVLLPHRGALVTLGPSFRGTVDRHLGDLARRLGRLDDAVGHLEDAVASLDAMAALGWAAHARASLATTLAERGDKARGDDARAAAVRADALEVAETLGMVRLAGSLTSAEDVTAPHAWRLVRAGDGWLLEAGTGPIHLRAGRGLEHLRVLLANPGRDVSAIHLESNGEAVDRMARVPLLDDEARSRYRKRLDAIEVDLERADRRGDQQRATELAAERDALVAELRRATGLGGRVRRTGDGSERARINVTRNLKRAVDQIAVHAPDVAAHLSASIHTGTMCRYDPAPGGPDTWEL